MRTEAQARPCLKRLLLFFGINHEQKMSTDLRRILITSESVQQTRASQ
jgi:hypothetical protein